MPGWIKKHPGKTPAMMNNPDVQKILSTFYAQTDSQMLCRTIASRKFKTIDEHSEYIRNGGCKNLIEALAKN